MATPLIIPQGVVVRLIWQFSGVDTAVNVLGAKNTGSIAITQTLVNTIAAAAKAALSSSGLNAQLGNSANFRQFGLRDISIANQPEFLDTAAGVAGTGGTGVLPFNVAYCVTLRTALAGRSFRGRYFQFGWASTANTTGGVPTGTAVTTAVAFVTAVGNALAANGLTPAVLSRHLLQANVWSTPQGRTTLWSTQRRRLIPGI